MCMHVCRLHRYTHMHTYTAVRTHEYMWHRYRHFIAHACIHMHS
jgi:hypothetical protein